MKAKCSYEWQPDLGYCLLFIFILDLLEKDISNLYQELSQHAAATNDLTDDDLTEASDCVTMEFLDRQISGNTGNPKKISMRQITDSPEF